MVAGLVSIIMPSWNTGRFIAESIRSVLEQTYANWELLLVDDCSSDNTDEVVRPFLSDTRIRYFKNEKNCGAALSRNRALREANGEWIAFLDSDDLWEPEKLEKQLAFMQAHDCCFSYHGYEKIDEQSRPLHVFVSGPARVVRRMIYRYDYVGQLTMMYSAKQFGTIQIKDIKKNNDYAIRLQLFKNDGAVCLYLDEDLARYRVRTQSISHDKFSKKLKSHFDLFHVCDEKSAPAALWYTCRNLVFGLHKKLKYETTR